MTSRVLKVEDCGAEGFRWITLKRITVGGSWRSSVLLPLVAATCMGRHVSNKFLPYIL